MKKVSRMVFGLAAYSMFLITFLYAIGFTGQLIVPKSINDGVVSGTVESIVINLALLTLFALQHSVMARPAFKRWWTRIVPEPIERSTFVLLASSALALLFWQWRPLPTAVWSMANPAGIMAVHTLFWCGWGIVLLSTFLISHFELFGLRQILADWTGRTQPAPIFKTPGLYRYVRHPIYLGFLLAFWATPMMSTGHLLFASVTTAYILVGIQLEERDLIRMFGRAYLVYRQQVGMLVPRLKALRIRTTAAIETGQS
jgi:protein-S-isoprenylcysteine O-methyltransferase Ste14